MRRHGKALPIRKPLLRALVQVLLIRICMNELNEPPVPPEYCVLLLEQQNFLWPVHGPELQEAWKKSESIHKIVSMEQAIHIDRILFSSKSFLVTTLQALAAMP